MTTYVVRNGIVVDKATGKPSRGGRIAAPRVMSDLPAYKSPRGTGVVEGRAARRNDMAAGDCREVDPSEYRADYQNERYARKHGLEWNSDGVHVRRRADG